MSAVIDTAHHVLKQLKRRDAEYEEEVTEAARQGLRPHYCKHGTDMWVDYDPICPGCEDPRTLYEEALDIAHGTQSEIVRRTSLIAQLFEEADLPTDVRRELSLWAARPMVRLFD